MIPAPPADFAPRYIAYRFVSLDVRNGAEPPAWARNVKNVIDSGHDGRDVEIARALNDDRDGTRKLSDGAREALLAYATNGTRVRR